MLTDSVDACHENCVSSDPSSRFEDEGSVVRDDYEARESVSGRRGITDDAPLIPFCDPQHVSGGMQMDASVLTS